MSTPQDGFASAFFRVFFGDLEITDNGDRLSYTYDETEDDDCEITIRVEDPSDVDLPQFQEKAQLRVIWGFMGGETTTRIVTIQEAKPHYDKESVYIVLACTEKGASMKSASDRSIAKDGLVGAAQDKADKHGLDAYLEVPDDGIRLDSLPGESTTQYITRVNRARAERMYAEQQKQTPDQQQKAIRILLKDYRENYHKKEFEVRRQVQQEYEDGADINVEEEVKRRVNKVDNLSKWLSENFKGPNDMSAPQAGKSDKQFLDDLGKRTRNGTTIIETRDNNLIIKKRNYNQRPYKAYVFGDTIGELLEFAPETHNRRKKGSAAALGFSGWDALNKSFFNGQADPTNPANNASLAKAIDMIRQGELIQKQGGGRTIYLTRPTGKLTTTTIPSGSNLIIREDPGTGRETRTFVPANHLPIIDNSGNTGKIEEFPIVVGVSVDDHVSALKKAVDEFRDKDKAKTKGLL
jgi:hypothetical protein